MGVDAQKCQPRWVGVCGVMGSHPDSLLFVCLCGWVICAPPNPSIPLQIRTITAASLPFCRLSLKMALSIPLFMPRLMWSSADRMSLGDYFIQRQRKEKGRQDWKVCRKKKRTLLLGQFIFSTHSPMSFHCNNCINNKCGIFDSLHLSKEAERSKSHPYCHICTIPPSFIILSQYMCRVNMCGWALGNKTNKERNRNTFHHSIKSRKWHTITPYANG